MGKSLRVVTARVFFVLSRFFYFCSAEHFLTSGICRLEQVARCDGKFGDIRHH